MLAYLHLVSVLVFCTLVGIFLGEYISFRRGVSLELMQVIGGMAGMLTGQGFDGLADPDVICDQFGAVSRFHGHYCQVFS